MQGFGSNPTGTIVNLDAAEFLDVNHQWVAGHPDAADTSADIQRRADNQNYSVNADELVAQITRIVTP